MRRGMSSGPLFVATPFANARERASRGCGSQGWKRFASSGREGGGVLLTR